MKIATTIGEMYRYTNFDPAEAVRAYEGTGFRYLDYSFYRVLDAGHRFMTDDWKNQVAETGEAAAKLGMKFVQAHSPDYNPFQNPEDTEFHERGILATIRSIEACGMLGIPNIVVHTGSTLDYTYPDDKEAYFKAKEPFIRALIPAMEKWNVRVCIENSAEGNMGSRYFFMTGEDMNDFIDYMNHPLIGGCWDVGHGHMRGIPPHDELVSLGRNLNAVHIHDNDGRGDQHIAPFFGSIDMDSVMQGLIDADYKGYFTFEADSLLPYRTGHGSGRLSTPPLAVKRAMLAMLYQIGKSCLEAYGLYEE